MLVILGLMLFALLCPSRNLPTNLDTLLKSLWRLSGPVAVTWAIFVLVLIGTTAYAILLLIHHLGTVGTNTDHLRQIILSIPVLIAAVAGLIAMPMTLIRLHYTRRQTLAKEEGLITDRINAAVLGLGAEKTVKFVDCDFSFAKIETDLSETEFFQCDLFYASGIFLGQAKSVAQCLITGTKTTLQFADDQFDLQNNFGSDSVAKLSLGSHLELPDHWMHEATPHQTLKEAWFSWKLTSALLNENKYET